MSDCMITRRGGNTGGGGEITLQEKEVTPATSAINVTADEGYTGLSKVKVNAISPVLAANTYTPGTQNQEIQAGRWLTGRQLIQGDGNLIAANIKKGVSIFDVTGSYEGEGVNLQAKTVTPSTAQNVVTADSGYNGLSSVTVSGDADLIASNIKSGVSIFGVTGSFDGGGGGLDHNSAILKVITATGNSVAVTGSGYSAAHQQADGFIRGGNAAVTDHFFTIPVSSFGNFSITVTSTYGNENYSASIASAGEVYEYICGGRNVILDSTYGLQSGFTWDSGSLYYYDATNKYIYRGGNATNEVTFSPTVDMTCYRYFYASFKSGNGALGYIDLKRNGTTFCSISDNSGSSYSEQVDINKTRFTDEANIVFGPNMAFIYEIVLY